MVCTVFQDSNFGFKFNKTVLKKLKGVKIIFKNDNIKPTNV